MLTPGSIVGNEGMAKNMETIAVRDVGCGRWVRVRWDCVRFPKPEKLIRGSCTMLIMLSKYLVYDLRGKPQSIIIGRHRR